MYIYLYIYVGNYPSFIFYKSMLVLREKKSVTNKKYTSIIHFNYFTGLTFLNLIFLGM